jgi:hypothetical protein
MNIIKVSTTNRDEVSFQRNPAGDIEVFHVNRTGNDSKLGAGHSGPPDDTKVATIIKEDARALSQFFAQFA